MRTATMTLREAVTLRKRIWEHIEKWYGTGSWDWPTLRMIYPQSARILKECHRVILENGGTL